MVIRPFGVLRLSVGVTHSRIFTGQQMKLEPWLGGRNIQLFSGRYTQDRGAAHLNLGLGNRNSIRVAAAWELAAMWFVKISMVGYGQSEYQTCGFNE